MRMELSRKGKFSAIMAAPANPGRCGAADNKDFGYEVKIELPSNQLDKDDFILDHNLIAKYFADTFGKEPWILSCEMIAARTLVHFYNQLEDRGVLRVEVNIIAADVNHKALWDTTKDDVPEMPEVQSQFANIGANWAKAEEEKEPVEVG